VTIPSPRKVRKARIEIIPLIDIIFFLLATFVMVSLSMIKNRGIPVNLPAASSATAQERKDYTAITVTKEGDLYFNKEAMSLEGIVERLRLLKLNEADPPVFQGGIWNSGCRAR
jgi:biopolymer transport protein ExbD